MLTDRPQRTWWRRHPLLTTVAAAVALWWLWLGWYPLVILVTTTGVVVAVRRRKRAATIRDAGLRARADYEHQLTLAGDPHGTFGRYPPIPADWYVRPRPMAPVARPAPPRW
ncbi:hypothetical protein FK535_09130 [Mycolicibacterium sp. 018/SC-01/001]|uniref:hypothetical protein n=1 Tax=Mycolicibacterium sp. 018/SC-01/001 TaxID=2592069 RepID=UPI00117DF507|nr:hypothetical protein [Mycolicibacterium sp. 018/SC-01/001]TRW85548.1 hypothetical protein FK535_09130 [Mycolicibacterium sp. 018/SC-01/001]